MKSSNAILGLFTETSLHAGAGQALGVIDLPIQREAHTYWPCVYGSAVKGAMRAKAEAGQGGSGPALADAETNQIFGHAPEGKGSASEYAGALAVGDARLLLLPVRSLTTHFRWVTCPAALRRFFRDVERLGVQESFGVDWSAFANHCQSITDCFKNDVDSEIALVAEEEVYLFLEEYCFTVQPEPDKLKPLVAALAKLMPKGSEGALQKQLAIVADDAFRHLVEHATPVNAHVRLTAAKTVDKGALWYEETLPPETLLYVGLNASKTRNGSGETLNAKDVLESVQTQLFGEPAYLQLGGNETVGMGWCHVAFLPSPVGRGAEGEGKEG
jgi:CRISPR-associated protein Cmr4